MHAVVFEGALTWYALVDHQSQFGGQFEKSEGLGSHGCLSCPQVELASKRKADCAGEADIKGRGEVEWGPEVSVWSIYDRPGSECYGRFRINFSLTGNKGEQHENLLQTMLIVLHVNVSDADMVSSNSSRLHWAAAIF